MMAIKLVVIGIVQGVGFRPFIHRLALKTNVKGYVRNVGGSEVEIFIEGDETNIAEFIRYLVIEKPQPAIIEEIEFFEARPQGFKDFKILKSSSAKVRKSMIPPDIGICDECLREVLNEHDRRYRYAFNSCAWCGPRFSMMYRVPYDRENTSMNKYRLCDECLREYRDINNVRRYHAQGISCPRDGPRLWLTDRNGVKIDVDDPIKETAKLVDEGYIVGIKGLGGYHIAALASNDDVVLKLRRRKRRPYKPFAIMALNVEVANKLVHISDEALRILTSPQKPILLLPKREDTPASKYVSPGLTHEGVFLPYTALHYLLLMDTKDKFLLMTSGNVHGKPMCIDEACAYSKLKDIVDYFLVHDREIVNRVDDSVIRFTDGEPVMLRRGRGYAPVWIRIGRKLKRSVIALGADLQSAGAVAFEDKVVLTQYIGDADDYDILSDLDKYLRYFIRTYDIDPSKSLIVVDKHPNYYSRLLGLKYAETYGCEVVEVQHHYAHILSVLGEYRIIEEDVIGIAIDGTGYGDDGNIWGGEVIMVKDDLSYVRLAHLMYQPLIGDVAVKYPRKFLISILQKFLDVNEIIRVIKLRNNELNHGDLLQEMRVIKALINKGMYVWTSSTGRILDAVSSLLNVCNERTYEGEPAIKLEAHAKGGKLIDGIKAPLILNGDVYVIDTDELFKSVVEFIDYNSNDIAYTVQFTLGEALGSTVVNALKGRRVSINKVPIAGGASVNDIIVKGIKSVLKAHDLELLMPKKIPPNDGGIALGQVVASLKYQ